MKPLQIKACLDGRPGHEKQTQGVIAALERLTPVAATYEKLPRPSVVTGLISWIVYLGTWGLRILPQRGSTAVDLIIGTGAATHIPMLRLKGRSQAKIVTCMTPDPLLLGKIDLCLVPHHDQPPQRPNIFTTIGPPGLPARARLTDSQRSLILVGGRDEKSHVWQTAALVSQIETLLAREPDLIWTITSSPRTPIECERRLQVLADAYPQVTFYRAQDTARGWIEAAYAQNMTAWVTADSISMIYEALTAGCRVGVLPVKWKKPHNKFQKSIDYLVDRHIVMVYEDWLNNARHKVQPAALDEASRCAEEILRRWWPDRLP
jgi:hypothetical protein